MVADLYVQIPAYRDRELAPTLRSLYGKAADPGRLRVRVLWQREDSDGLPDDVRMLPGLELVESRAADSQGCNWARRELQGAWAGERYTLLLDSHHRFAAGWDVAALAMLEAARAGGAAKPLLTAYLPGYDPDREPHGRARRPFKIYPYLREEGVLTRLKSAPIRGWTGLDRPVPADFVSLHFILADGGFNTEVVADPRIYFFGDEVLTSWRSFAAGYTLLHPHRVLGWHAYSRTHRVPHWSQHPDWRDRHRDSLELLRREFTPRRRRHGRPTVADYERMTGVPLVLT